MFSISSIYHCEENLFQISDFIEIGVSAESIPTKWFALNINGYTVALKEGPATFQQQVITPQYI